MQKTYWFLAFVFYILLTSFTEDLRFRKINMSSGLSYNSVLCVLEENDGQLWIGTREGLNKYNGLGNIIYKHNYNDSLSLSNSHVNSLYETTNSEIWVGTARGLNLFNRNEENFVQFLPSIDSTGLTNGYVRSITENVDGKIWVGTSYGLNIYDPHCKCFQHIFLEETSAFSNNIISLYRDKQDRLWIGSQGGLYVWENYQFKYIEINPNIQKGSEAFEVRDIKQDDEGVIWIATEKYGVYSFEYDKGVASQLEHFHTGNSEMSSNQIRKIYIDGDDLWLGSLDGLIILEKSTSRITNIIYSIDRPGGISNSSIHDIIKDKNGGFWLATYTGGMNYYHPQNNLFQHYKHIVGSSNSISSNVVSGFLELENGNILIYTEAAGLNYLNLKTNRFEKFIEKEINNLSNNDIKSIAADKLGNLWIGTFNGLNYFDRKTKYFTKFFHDPDNTNSLNQNQVHAVYVDKEGLVWIGMNMGVFQVYNPKTRVFKSFPEIGSIVNTIFEDQKGRIWVGDRFGLGCIDRKSQLTIDISNLTLNHEEQMKYINWIGEDTSENIWIGTQSSGLFLFKSGKTYHFTKENGLVDNTINAILEDDKGNFWISTNKGISKTIYTENEQGVPKLRSIGFTTVNGLQGEQFEPGSAYKNSSEKMFFGGLNGFNAFFPEKIEKIEFFPTVILTDFQINFINKSPNSPDPSEKRSITDISKLILKYSEHNITLGFAGINYINPEGSYYQYMLSGFDNNWIDLGNQRTINFTYLPIGKHELRIKASTNPDIWSNEYTKLEIIVLPPWWRTVWAYLLYLTILIFLLYIFFLYSQRWANLKNELTMEHYMRKKDLELHESKLKFFTDISHELRTPLTLILAPLERIMLLSGFNDQLNKQLALIQKNGQRMMQLIDQVLNLRKLETGHEKLQAAKGDIVSFLKEISLSFNEVATSKNIRFEFKCDKEKISLWYDQDKVEIIICNLLSNAFKNTQNGGSVFFTVEEKDERASGNALSSKIKMQSVIISIADNGRGIDEVDLERIFDRFYSKKNDDFANKGLGVGLELTKRLIDLHKGEIRVESRKSTDTIDGHTKFSVYLPLGKKYLTKDEKISSFRNIEDPSTYPKELQLKEQVFSDIHINENVELPSISDRDKQALLIIEDNSEVRAFVRSLFLDNYVVEEAENGLIGWNMAIQTIPDLIISDIMMPEINGIELCEKLKSDIRTSHIPIILLTARTTLTLKYEGLETGADEYITKPFSAQHLILRVKNLIQQRNKLRNHFQREAIMEPEKITVSSLDERLLKKAVDYISENIQNSSINVEKLSKEIGLSRVHFYRKIKSITNLTAVEFIRNIRLKKAAMLLTQGKLSIKEVQYMVGFESADYFRKNFKNEFGMTPSEFASKNNPKV